MDETKQQILNNPLAYVVLFVLLGGQGADIFTSNNQNQTLSQLANDVEFALAEIIDNSERIASNDREISELRSEVNLNKQLLIDLRLSVEELEDELIKFNENL